MRKIMAYAAKIGLITATGLLIGVSVVFALNPYSGPVADSVAVLKSMGVTCDSCAGRIEKALKEKADMASVEVDVETGLVTIAYDSKKITPEALAETVTALGYVSNIMQVVTAEEYRAKTGRSASLQTPAKTGGCGCCNKNRN